MKVFSVSVEDDCADTLKKVEADKLSFVSYDDKRFYPDFAHNNLSKDIRETWHNNFLVAIEEKNIIQIKEILKETPDDYINKIFDKKTPLMYALSSYDDKFFSFLLSLRGIDPNIAGTYGGSPLIFSAISRQKDKFLEILLQHPKTDPNIPDRYGRTPLHVAVRTSNYRAIEFLLAHPLIDVNARVKELGIYRETPLMYASRLGDTRAMKMLLSHLKIEINFVTKDLRPDLRQKIKLSFNQNTGVQGSKRGKILNESDVFLTTALYYALTHNHPEAIKLLLAQADIDVNVELTNKKTVLHYAVLHSNLGNVKLLLAHKGIDILVKDSRNGFKYSPLDYAIYDAGDLYVKELLKHNDTIGYFKNNSETINILKKAININNITIFSDILDYCIANGLLNLTVAQKLYEYILLHNDRFLDSFMTNIPIEIKFQLKP